MVHSYTLYDQQFCEKKNSTFHRFVKNHWCKLKKICIARSSHRSRLLDRQISTVVWCAKDFPLRRKLISSLANLQSTFAKWSSIIRENTSYSSAIAMIIKSRKLFTFFLSRMKWCESSGRKRWSLRHTRCNVMKFVLCFFLEAFLAKEHNKNTIKIIIITTTTRKHGILERSLRTSLWVSVKNDCCQSLNSRTGDFFFSSKNRYHLK